MSNDPTPLTAEELAGLDVVFGDGARVILITRDAHNAIEATQIVTRLRATIQALKDQLEAQGVSLTLRTTEVRLAGEGIERQNVELARLYAEIERLKGSITEAVQAERDRCVSAGNFIFNRFFEKEVCTNEDAERFGTDVRAAWKHGAVAAFNWVRALIRRDSLPTPPSGGKEG